LTCRIDRFRYIQFPSKSERDLGIAQLFCYIIRRTCRRSIRVRRDDFSTAEVSTDEPDEALPIARTAAAVSLRGKYRLHLLPVRRIEEIQIDHSVQR
jgi:hypothetical protein